MAKKLLSVLTALSVGAAMYASSGMSVNALRVDNSQEAANISNSINGKRYAYRQDDNFDRMLSSLAKENRRGMAPITDPAGDKKEYQRSSISFFTFMGEQCAREEKVSPTILSFDGDDTIYIESPISNNAQGGWIKGTRDGDILEIECPQILVEWEEEDWFTGEMTTWTYYVSVLSEQYDEELGGYTFKPVDDDEQVYRFVIGENNTLVSETPGLMLGVTGCYDEWHNQVDPETPGCVWEWKGNGDVDMTIQPLQYSPVTPPVGFEPDSYALICDSQSSLVKAGADGNKFYVQGLFNRLPEAWVCGEINGDEVTFNTQYLGLDRQSWSYIFLLGVVYEPDPATPDMLMPVLKESVTLSYDKELGLLRQKDAGIMFNTNPFIDDLYYITELDNIILKSQNIVSDYVPQTPVGVYGWQYEEDVINGCFGFTIRPFTKDYIMLNQENLFYEILKDDVPITVNVDGEETSRIPLDYSDDVLRMFKDERYLTFFEPVKNFKVRAIYVLDNEEYFSDYAELTLSDTGVDTIELVEKAVEYYTIAGVKVNNPEKGTLVIKRSILSDGTVKFTKVIF